MTQWRSIFKFPIQLYSICKTLPQQFPFITRPRFGAVKLAPCLAFLRSKSWHVGPRFYGKGPKKVCCLMWLSYFMALHGYLFIHRSSWTFFYVSAVTLSEEILEIILTNTVIIDANPTRMTFGYCTGTDASVKKKGKWLDHSSLGLPWP